MEGNVVNDFVFALRQRVPPLVISEFTLGMFSMLFIIFFVIMGFNELWKGFIWLFQHVLKKAAIRTGQALKFIFSHLLWWIFCSLMMTVMIMAIIFAIKNYCYGWIAGALAGYLDEDSWVWQIPIYCFPAITQVGAWLEQAVGLTEQK